MPWFHQVLSGVKIEHGKWCRVVYSRLPITPAILRRSRQVCIKDCKKISFDNIMLWAACLVTFFSLGRNYSWTWESIWSFYSPFLWGPGSRQSIRLHGHFKANKKIKDGPRLEMCQDLLRKNRRHLMPSSSHGGLSVSKGKQFSPSLPLRVRNPFVKVKHVRKNSFRAGYYIATTPQFMHTVEN